MNSVKFDDELLIKLVKSNPHLYQAPKNNQHNHVFIRKNLWKQISIELNRDVHFVQTRWRDLRDRYGKETKKLIECKTTSCSWKHFEELSFLNGVLKRRNKKPRNSSYQEVSYLSNSVNSESHQNVSRPIHENLLEVKSEPLDNEEPDRINSEENISQLNNPDDFLSQSWSLKPEDYDENSKSPVPSKRNKSFENYDYQRTVNMSLEENEFDVFGKLTAITLKNLSRERAILAQQFIQTYLTEQKLAELNEE